MIGEPKIFVMCDECEEDFEFSMTALVRHSWDCRNLERNMLRDGWLIEGEDRHICPDCAFDREQSA